MGGPQETQVDRHRAGRPSLKITRQRSPGEADAFVVEVWNPFAGNYQSADTVKTAIKRAGELANLICQMRLRQHPKLNVLADVPVASETDDRQWAEFRINAATIPSYDTRRFDLPGWKRETGLTDAANITCAKVGYAIPISEPS